MKTARQLTLLTLLVALSALYAADPADKPAAAPKPTPEAEAKAAAAEGQKLAGGLTPSLPPRTFGIPTPMEEFGLRPNIGDVTVTEVRNPLGQLALNEHILLSRRLNQVTNPWEELAPGTALVVDGRKAVIVQIEPAEAPKDVGTANLRVTVRAKEIGGPELSLTWQQNLQLLNHRVEVGERREIVNRVKRELRVGSHLIVDGNRVLITSFKLTAQAGAALETNPPHTLEVDYSGISSPPGTLHSRENRAESGMEPTWHFRQNPAQGGADSLPQAMADGSIRMVTWSFVRRTVGGHPDPEGIQPNVIIIHRRRGLVTRIEAPVDDPTVATVEAQFSFDGRVLTRMFDWKLTQNSTKEVRWQLKPHPSETYLLIYAVNDPNIRFQVTPKSLIKANERALASLQALRNINRALPNQGTIRNLGTNTVEKQLRILDEIYKSDASQVLKAAVKRQTVITLAQRYEQLAIHHKALANEKRLRSEMALAAARRLELNAWANQRKANFLKGQLPAGSLADLQNNAVTNDTKELPLNSIAVADRDVATYKQATLAKTASDKAQDYTQFFGQAVAQANAAAKLRKTATQFRAATPPDEKKSTHYYLLSLKMWQEYLLRSEGLQKEERGLVKRGFVKSPLPPDPLIPEILLRQGWIYRELGLKEKAVQMFFNVLASSLQQEAFNLVRLKRINLVAKSQIANAYYEDPQKLSDYEEAIVKLKSIMVQPPGKDIEDHELDIEQIQLRYMRALYFAIRAIDRRITRDNRRLKLLKPTSLEHDALLSQISNFAKNRNEHWRSLAKQSAEFIEQYTRTNTRQSVRYDGEVRYYKILAHQALGNEQHVLREMEVLLQNSSVSSELEKVWASTRLQIIMDMANLVYVEAIQLQSDLERMVQLTDGTAPVQTGANDPRTLLHDSVQVHLNAAITYYKWAQSFDQSYRSQIFLRQQLAFAYERLGQKQLALDQLNELVPLFELHPGDFTPVLKLVKHKAHLRQNNLRIEIEQLKKSSQR